MRAELVKNQGKVFSDSLSAQIMHSQAEQVVRAIDCELKDICFRISRTTFCLTLYLFFYKSYFFLNE